MTEPVEHPNRQLEKLITNNNASAGQQKQEAREWEAKKIVRYCGDPDTPFQQKMGYVLSALASRNTEIREVLEGLSSLLHIPNSEPQRCWCTGDRNYQFTHSPACLAARALWESASE